MKTIIGIGETVWDMLPAGKQLGGAPLNFAFFAGVLGAHSYVVSAIGDDPLGDETLEAMEQTGIDLSLLQRNALPTSRVIVTLGEGGIPEYEIVEGVAWDAIECIPEAMEKIRTADAICWGSLAQRSDKSRANILRMLDAAPEHCLKVFDINIRQHFYSEQLIRASLERADVLKLNEDELPLLKDMFGIEEDNTAAIHTLAETFGLDTIIFTQGARCSEIYGREGLLSSIDTPKVKVADTVGAGDSFTAAYITSILQGKSAARAHEAAVKVSAYVCTQLGAVNPLPEDLLNL